MTAAKRSTKSVVLDLMVCVLLSLLSGMSTLLRAALDGYHALIYVVLDDMTRHQWTTDSNNLLCD